MNTTNLSKILKLGITLLVVGNLLSVLSYLMGFAGPLIFLSLLLLAAWAICKLWKGAGAEEIAGEAGNAARRVAGSGAQLAAKALRASKSAIRAISMEWRKSDSSL
ncbi:MAG: hypothetical protein N2322_00495 [Terrimicrobiaceae bacterium]|nr:hypothetical protein [Terrimicrobiaceae bacterium]